jgi:hypothetical protein
MTFPSRTSTSLTRARTWSHGSTPNDVFRRRMIGLAISLTAASILRKRHASNSLSSGTSRPSWEAVRSRGIAQVFGTAFAKLLMTISKRLLIGCGSWRRAAALFVMIARSQCEIRNEEFAAYDAVGNPVLRERHVRSQTISRCVARCVSLWFRQPCFLVFPGCSAFF